MNLSDIHLLYAYNDWANRQILATSAQLSAEQFVTRTSHCFGSLRGTLVHAMDGERAWRMLYQQQTLDYFGALTEDMFPTIESVAQRWKQESQAMREYLASLTDDDMTSIVRYTVEEGKRERALWHCLFHVVNHGTQHRSEAAAILTDYGVSPGELDFTAFLNQQAKAHASIDES